MEEGKEGTKSKTECPYTLLAKLLLPLLLLSPRYQFLSLSLSLFLSLNIVFFFFWWLNGEFFRSNRRWNWSLGCWKLSKFTHLLNYKAGLSYVFLFFLNFNFNFINFLCFFMRVFILFYLFIYVCLWIGVEFLILKKWERKKYFLSNILHIKKKKEKKKLI